MKAIRRQGFREPTPIQTLVIPIVTRGRDVVVEAKTGSGKTLAYGLPLLNREPRQTVFPEILVVVPTRELAQQIEAELVRNAGELARPVVSLTGGGGMDRQKALLDKGALVIVGTLGRLEEMLERKLLNLEHIHTVVLDEVDELLRGGFSGNLSALFAQLPAERQTLLFSASIPTEVESVAKQFTRDPARLRLSVSRELPAELTHSVLHTTVSRRIADLVGYLRAEKPFQALIFCGTRHETEEVNEAISELGLKAEFLHGELSPNKRKQLLDQFRAGDLPVLVASDLIARGLDLPGVDLVVNYSLPQGIPAYLHRAGRTGRAGRPGEVMSLIIEQQHDRYEKLKPTFALESVEVSANGKLVRRRPVISREERNIKHGKLPSRAFHQEADAKAEAPVRAERGERGALTDTRKPKPDTKARTERAPRRDAMGHDARKSRPSSSSAPEIRRPRRDGAGKDDRRPSRATATREERTPRRAAPGREERTPRRETGGREERTPRRAAPGREERKPRRETGGREERTPRREGSARDDRKPAKRESKAPKARQPARREITDRKPPRGR